LKQKNRLADSHIKNIIKEDVEEEAGIKTLKSFGTIS